MSARSDRFVRHALHLVLLCGIAVAPQLAADDAGDRRFVEQALSIIFSATLPDVRDPIKVAVAGKDDDPATSNRIVTLLEGTAARQGRSPMRFDATAVILPETRNIDLPGMTAILIIDSAPLSFGRLQAFAFAKKVLTMSRRVQDIGLVDVVILPGEKQQYDEMYASDTMLKEHGVTLALEIRKKMQAAAASEADDLFSAARKLQEAQHGKPGPSWLKIVKMYRMAITKRPNEKSTPVLSLNGITNTPYVPYFFLSEALAMIGDCEGARASLERSEPANRAKMVGVDQKKLKNTVEQCGRRPPSTVADLNDRPEETWGISSF